MVDAIELRCFEFYLNKIFPLNLNWEVDRKWEWFKKDDFR